MNLIWERTVPIVTGLDGDGVVSFCFMTYFSHPPAIIKKTKKIKLYFLKSNQHVKNILL